MGPAEVGAERVEFPGAGGQPLVGRLELPEAEPLGYAVFAHCFTCSKDSVAASRVSRGLAARGVAVLRFDFTGLGQSGGDFAETCFSSTIEDVVAAAGYLEQRGRAACLLVGHSLGGAAVIGAAARLDGVRAVVTIAAPCDPGHLAGLLDDARRETERDGSARVVLAGRAFTLHHAFFEDIAAQPQRRRLAELGRPLLVLHSPQDQVVPVEEARTIVSAAGDRASLVVLDGADHLLTRRADADFAAGVIAAWAARYLQDPDQE